MTYKSLYDIIELKKDFQVYGGSLDLVLTSIARILGKKNKTKQDCSSLAFQSPRIIRALIDYKNNNPDDKKLLELLRDSINLALKIYKQYDNPRIRKDVLRFRKKIIEWGYRDILRTGLRQYYDRINLIVAKPEFSWKAAEKLNKIVGSKKVIMLVIGHGATNIGMDVFLRHQELSQKRNVLFYVFRFSRTKYKKYEDKTPQLTPTEIQYLQKQAIGRKIIIYDENYFTGKTMKQVVQYMSKNVFRHHKIDILYNLNTND